MSIFMLLSIVMSEKSTDVIEQLCNLVINSAKRRGVLENFWNKSMMSAGELLQTKLKRMFLAQSMSHEMYSNIFWSDMNINDSAIIE